jgi:hypothetical protein
VTRSSYEADEKTFFGPGLIRTQERTAGPLSPYKPQAPRSNPEVLLCDSPQPWSAAGMLRLSGLKPYALAAAELGSRGLPKM